MSLDRSADRRQQPVHASFRYRRSPHPPGPRHEAQTFFDPPVQPRAIAFVLRYEIPFVQRDHARATGFDDRLSDPLVVSRHAFGRVDHEQSRIDTGEGAPRTEEGEVLERVFDEHLPAHPRGVDDPERSHPLGAPAGGVATGGGGGGFGSGAGGDSDGASSDQPEARSAIRSRLRLARMSDIAGPIPNVNADAGDIHNRRCTNDTSIKCTNNTPCLPNGTCQYFFGSNLPLMVRATLKALLRPTGASASRCT